MLLRKGLGFPVKNIRKVLTLVFAVISTLAVILALFVAPLRANPSVLNAPSDWEIVTGNFSEDGTQLLPSSVAIWNVPLPVGCAIQTKTLNKKALRTWTVDGQDFAFAQHLQDHLFFHWTTPGELFALSDLLLKKEIALGDHPTD